MNETETFPLDGGSYERVDGKLRQLEPPTAPPLGKSAAAAAAPPATPSVASSPATASVARPSRARSGANE